MINYGDLDLDANITEGYLTAFIREELTKAGFHRVVLGLSGGLDSATVAYLSVKALGKENVIAAVMPYKSSNMENIKDADKIISVLDIKRHHFDITSIVDPYFEKFRDADNTRRGNMMARARMCVLYDLSKMENALVIGTSNKTEILLGYGTIFGDLASAINPLGDLYKTQVKLLAKHLGVLDKIITKAPSADLFVGQTDESDYGFTYSEADKLLYLLVDERCTPAQCEKLGFDKKFIDLVIAKIIKNQFKRSTPIIAKLSNRTIGIDFRYPRDWET